MKASDGSMHKGNFLPKLFSSTLAAFMISFGDYDSFNYPHVLNHKVLVII
jgi:hypothetical protein